MLTLLHCETNTPTDASGGQQYGTEPSTAASMPGTSADLLLMSGAAKACLILIGTTGLIRTYTPYAAQRVREMFQLELAAEQPFLQYLPPELAADAMMAFHAAIGGSSAQYTLSHTDKDGKPLFIQIQLEAAKNNAGVIEGAVATCTDVTEKHLLTDASRRTRHTMLLFRGLPLPAYIVDPQNMQVLAANRKALAFYGYTAEEFVALNVADLHPHDKKESIRRQITDSCNRGNSVVREWNQLTRDGKPLVVELWDTAIKYEGRRVRLVLVNDITEKKLVEQELRESSERFGYVTNLTADIVWDWQVGEDTILWSSHYQHIMGWQLPASRRLPVSHTLECIHPEDRDRVRDYVVNMIQHSPEPDWENAFRYRRSDGSYAIVLDKAIMIRDDAGKVVRMIGAMHDISEQQFQQDLQELELRVYALSSQPSVALPAVLKELVEGMSVLHNGAEVCLVLFPELGQPTMIAPGIAATAVPWLLQFATEKGFPDHTGSHGLQTYTLSLEEGLALSSGPVQPRCLWIAPVQLPNEGPRAVLMLLEKGLREPTNLELNAWLRIKNLLRTLLVHHAFVEQIRLANERFDNVLQATHDLIWDWNLLTGAFYRSPEGMRKIFGIMPQSAISVTGAGEWLDRLHPDDLAMVQGLIAEVLQDGTRDKFEVEYRVRRADGSFAYLYDRCIIVRNSFGRPVRMIGAAQDITTRKILEQELLAQELEQQRVISQASIDTQEQERAEIGKELHDNVNQILTTTKLYLDLALDNPAMQQDLMAKASKNIIHVINELRQLSRSLMDPSLGDLGLTDSVRDLVENINLTRKVSLTLNIEENLDVYLDESKKLMVFRILQEALNNIIRHAKASKSQVSLKVVRDKTMHLRISDNGVGFDPEKIVSGIGLKNIRNRVYLINGTLQIESGPAKGTTINIKFPIQKVQNTDG